jgi:phosphatidate phosphatase LPIN
MLNIYRCANFRPQSPSRTPFYAGFGNRLTDALSYRSVSIPSKRIFTINSNAEVSLDLVNLNKLRYSYVNMREVVDHYFPPVNTLVKSGGEEYTDFTYWRDPVLDLDDFSASEGESGEPEDENGSDDEDVNEEMGDSYISRDSIDDDGDGDDYRGLEESILSVSVDEDEVEDEADVDNDADVDDDDTTQVIDLQALEHSAKRRRERDIDGEIMSGIPGLVREESKH